MFYHNCNINAPTLFQSGPVSRPGGNNFELETDNLDWPEVDLGNLIIDLDADIDKTMSSTNTTSNSGNNLVKAGPRVNFINAMCAVQSHLRARPSFENLFKGIKDLCRA